MGIEGPFPARASEVAAAADLSNRVFRPLDQFKEGTMHLEFPLVFSHDHPERLWIIKDGSRVVSLVGSLERPVLIEGCRIPAAALGTVCTDPEYRGQGLAGRILAALLDHLRERGVHLVIISGDRSLYRRAGAVTAGLVRWIVAPAADPAGSGNPLDGNPLPGRTWAVREARESDFVQVLRLYEREPLRFERSLADLRAFVSALPHAYAGTRFRRLWVAVREGGKEAPNADRAGGQARVEAYLVTDGPATAPGAAPAATSTPPPPAPASTPVYWQAMEWGGVRRAVWSMAKELAARHGVAGVRFPVTDADHELLDVAATAGIAWETLPQHSWGGTWLALDPAGLVRDLTPLLGRELGDRLEQVLTRGTVAEGPSGDGEVLPILFGAKESWWAGSRTRWVEELSRRLAVPASLVEQSPLPLPLVWGFTLNFV